MAEANDLANVFQGAVAQGPTWFTHSNTAVLNSEILGVAAKWTGILVAASVVALFLIARSTLGEDLLSANRGSVVAIGTGEGVGSGLLLTLAWQASAQIDADELA
jgi:hypothetical protein